MKPTQALQELLDNSLGILIAFDDEGNVIFLNLTAINETGYHADEVRINQIFSQIFEDEKSIVETVKKRRGESISTVAYRSNFTCFPAKIRLSRLELNNRLKFNMISAVNLYNEHETKKLLEKTEEDIVEVMQARNEFVANITHELRTPVNGIKGHVKNLLLQKLEPEQKRTLEIVERCCVNMEKIINDLLDFSKIEAGKFLLEEAEFDIRACINQAIDTSIGIANEKGIKLTAHIAEDVPQTIIGDELRILQILNNLVSNAIKFTSIGYVRIEVHKTLDLNNEIELSFLVIDTGIGITPEEKEKLFKSFSQVDASTTRQYGGTGLGLFVCHQLVELMRGSISAESEKGKGSTFSFTIVVKKAPGSAKQAVDLAKQRVSVNENNDIKEKHETSSGKMVIIPKVEFIKDLYVYGSEKNKEEINNNLEKLIICIEMYEWEKSELFADNLKKLSEEGPKELKNSVFKLQMNLRKENYDESVTLYNQIKTLL